jgi:hypothetical protein
MAVCLWVRGSFLLYHVERLSFVGAGCTQGTNLRSFLNGRWLALPEWNEMKYRMGSPLHSYSHAYMSRR